MINLYKCEKCGHVYSDYEDAASCESGHLSIDWWWTCDKHNGNEELEYDVGAHLPKSLTIGSDTEGYDYNSDTGEHKERRYIGKYKLISVTLLDGNA